MLRTHLSFRSVTLLDPDSDRLPGGGRVAELLVARLPSHGFQPKTGLEEDWGWRVDIANDAFQLWIGCGGRHETEDGHLCFIEPSKPFVRRWFKKIATTETVERLAKAMEAILTTDGQVTELSWWTEEELAQVRWP